MKLHMPGGRRGRYASMVGVITGFALFGMLLNPATTASSVTVHSEAEDGQAAGLAAVDEGALGASGGQAIRFGDALAPAAKFLGRQGKELRYNGQPYRFVGVNAYGLAVCEGGAGYYTAAELDSFFQKLPAGTITRAWATSRATLADLDKLVGRAETHGQMLILSLADGANHCNKDNQQLDRAWYQSGYKTDYLAWVDTVVPRFKLSPAIGMWEIANEPGWGCQGGECGVTLAEMKSFLDTAAERIKLHDPNHLVESGTMGKDIASMASYADFAAAHGGPDIDVASIHEYEYDYDGNQGALHSFATYKTAAESVGKPIIIGETGALLGQPANTTCRNPAVTIEALLKSKFDSYLSQGASGVLGWNWMKIKPDWVSQGCPQAHNFYGTDNPVLTMLRGYQP